MLNSIKTNATYEDLYTIPKNMIGEIINGELYALPRPSFRHSNATFGLADIRIKYGQKNSGWWILVEPEIKLGENLFVPDLAGWEKKRLPNPPDTNWTTVPPDWICEVLSPSTSESDRKIKMPIYARFRVPYLWLIHPIEKTLEIFKLNDAQWILLVTYSDNDKVIAEPFNEVEIDLANLWWD
ncbi:MAG: Uma2 family endonuclease [Desulfobacterales bacterium]|nr:Uma2 family endonuclease [Desulfobacterales bacterium]